MPIQAFLIVAAAAAPPGLGREVGRLHNVPLGRKHCGLLERRRGVMGFPLPPLSSYSDEPEGEEFFYTASSPPTTYSSIA